MTRNVYVTRHNQLPPGYPRALAFDENFRFLVLFLQIIMSNIPDDYDFYFYNPSRAAAIAVATIFGVMVIAHAYFMISRKAYYMWPFVLGNILETVGYALRKASADHSTGPGGLGLFVAQELAIILGPAFMAATHYMVFGRLITYVSQKYTPINARRITFIFVTFDVLSIGIQGSGGSLFASDDPTMYDIAKAILLVGFIIQIVAFGIFGLVGVTYQIRARRDGENDPMWQRCLYTLYAGCVLILIRGIFRTIEFGTGEGGGRGYLLEIEAFYYGLEAAPILLATLLFIVSHPSRYIPSDKTVLLHPENREKEEAYSQSSGILCGRRKPSRDSVELKKPLTV